MQLAQHTKRAESRLQPDQLHPGCGLGVTEALELEPCRIDLNPSYGRWAALASAPLLTAWTSPGWTRPCDLARMIASDTRMATPAVSMTLRMVIPLSDMNR